MSADPPPYAELQISSNFSFLRGASHPEELAVTAAALGLVAFAVTDRNSVTGLVKAHLAAKQASIRMIVGCHVEVVDGPDVLIYPTDRAAYGRLTRLLTLGKRRVLKGECEIFQADLTDPNGVFVAGVGQIACVVAPTEVNTAFASELQKFRD